ncbi:MAG: hypothetical protein ACOCX4_10140, partial [Planctomycetota bacterium]
MQDRTASAQYAATLAAIQDATAGEHPDSERALRFSVRIVAEDAFRVWVRARLRDGRDSDAHGPSNSARGPSNSARGPSDAAVGVSLGAQSAPPCRVADAS